ncbi:MAG: hypothetical protein JNM89_02265 [Hyphomicrobiaceae bacterium]|nr:hypothetical protein [Hyphomicrobiaceae bacterium]
MCFSAPASFVAAGITGVVGIACLTKTQNVREVPLASMPLLFSLQQAIEGMLWLQLPVAPHGPEASLLTFVFLVYAKVFWPVYAPLAAALVEPDRQRRGAMLALVAGGVAVGLYFLSDIVSAKREAWILGGHIVYESKDHLPLGLAALYMLATCAAPLISSHRAIRVLGALVLAGASVTYAFYWQAFSSVWCFFAAVASGVLYHHFAERARLGTALRAE